MPVCTSIIDSDILYDCENPAVGGLETDVLIFNHEDIDKSAVTFDATNKVLMTNFQALTGKTGYLFQGVKQVNGVNFELVKKENGPDKWKHFFNGLILNPSAQNKEQLQNLSEGKKYAVIVNRKWKGANNAEAFEVYGYESGLELLTATGNSKENDGALPIQLGNADNFEEPKVPYTLLETDYATTLAAFNNKWAQA